MIRNFDGSRTNPFVPWFSESNYRSSNYMSSAVYIIYIYICICMIYMVLKNILFNMFRPKSSSVKLNFLIRFLYISYTLLIHFLIHFLYASYTLSYTFYFILYSWLIQIKKPGLKYRKERYTHGVHESCPIFKTTHPPCPTTSKILPPPWPWTSSFKRTLNLFKWQPIN